MAKQKLSTSKDRQASVTFQTPQTRKEKLEQLGMSLGLRRLVEGVEQGNVSLTVNLFIEYVFEHKDSFATWLKERAEKAMS